MNITKHAKNSFISYILQNEPHRAYTGDIYKTYIVFVGLQANYFNSITTALMHYQNEPNNSCVFQCNAFFPKHGNDYIKVYKIA